ncbi:ABC transporter ATP-binding protein [Vibrio palustris]|uniref:ABC transporter ATP-binding protein YtrB n=1 Tax=Vibrio palustris TaxID=1918946 RepID=A0A1R4B679_9VIBR|nr:ABC transporter ATP-binding protein [Vibrio palustris]SJL84386.1 ABC transporter ATP-binding protein YtrB [Vibrio palustris]
MKALITASNLRKSYSKENAGYALHEMDFTVQPGQVLGLLGHNGAGKSTLIRSLLGLQAFEGKVDINGFDPIKHHAQAMRSIACISDTNCLPDWMTVKQLIDYTAGVHPDFQKDHALEFLQGTSVNVKSLVRSLSKGMKVQVHLALVMATQCRILILDEPTLGLDLMYRDTFYRQMLKWFEDGEGARSVIIASHEVSEIEHLLTDVLILKQGQKIVHSTMFELTDEYFILEAANTYDEQVKALAPISSEAGLGTTRWLLRGHQRDTVSEWGNIYTVKLADVFIALQKEHNV